MSSITKKDLKQYRSRKREIGYLRAKLAEQPAMVSDSVMGSMADWPYTEGVVQIRGVDTVTRKRWRADLATLIEKCAAVDRFIEGIENSDIRMYVRLRYVEGQSWEQVLSNSEMSEDRTIDAVRKAVENYLKKVL